MVDGRTEMIKNHNLVTVLEVSDDLVSFVRVLIL